MEHTWGIPSQTFLWWFIAASALAVVATLAHRRRLWRGDTDARAESLTPGQVAYLSGGADRAVHASLTWLRKADVVDVDEQSGKFRRLGGVPMGGSQLDSATLHAAGQGVRASQIRHERSVLAALEELRSDLERRGLLMSDEARRSARLGVWALLGLVVIGLLRLFAGAAAGKPVGYLIAVLAVLTPIAVVLFFRRPRLTRAGQSSLGALKRKYQTLDRKYRPAWQTYDPMTTAMAVGLFGAIVLWEADPVLAGAANISPLQSGGAGYAGSSGSYAGDSGGSGGDGGGGGGGGGGGCGGGGCGG